MAERPEDLNLPVTVVQRIIKEALPDGVIVSKEARQTISRASSVFVLYLTACAVTHANKAKRKTLAVNDILAAMSDMEFEQFVEPLNEALKNRKDAMAFQAAAKKSKAAAAKSSANETADGDENEEDIEEIDEDEEPAIQEQSKLPDDDEVEEEEVGGEQDTPSDQVNKKAKLSHQEADEDEESRSGGGAGSTDNDD